MRNCQASGKTRPVICITWAAKATQLIQLSQHQSLQHYETTVLFMLLIQSGTYEWYAALHISRTLTKQLNANPVYSWLAAFHVTAAAGVLMPSWLVITYSLACKIPGPVHEKPLAVRGSMRQALHCAHAVPTQACQSDLEAGLKARAMSL